MLTLYRMYFLRFQMCNRLPEMMKTGMRGYFLFTTALREMFQRFETREMLRSFAARRIYCLKLVLNGFTHPGE